MEITAYHVTISQDVIIVDVPMNYHPQNNGTINGSIIGKNYEVVSIDVNTQYNLTVTDIKGDDVVMLRKLDIESIFVCSVMTGNAIH